MQSNYQDKRLNLKEGLTALQSIIDQTQNDLNKYIEKNGKDSRGAFFIKYKIDELKSIYACINDFLTESDQSYLFALKQLGEQKHTVKKLALICYWYGILDMPELIKKPASYFEYLIKENPGAHQMPFCFWKPENADGTPRKMDDPKNPRYSNKPIIPFEILKKLATT